MYNLGHSNFDIIANYIYAKIMIISTIDLNTLSY